MRKEGHHYGETAQNLELGIFFSRCMDALMVGVLDGKLLGRKGMRSMLRSAKDSYNRLVNIGYEALALDIALGRVNDEEQMIEALENKRGLTLDDKQEYLDKVTQISQQKKDERKPANTHYLGFVDYVRSRLFDEIAEQADAKEQEKTAAAASNPIRSVASNDPARIMDRPEPGGEAYWRNMLKQLTTSVHLLETGKDGKKSLGDDELELLAKAAFNRYLYFRQAGYEQIALDAILIMGKPFENLPEAIETKSGLTAGKTYRYLKELLGTIKCNKNMNHHFQYFLSKIGMDLYNDLVKAEATSYLEGIKREYLKK